MSDRIKIPVGKFADDEALRRKREEKRKEREGVVCQLPISKFADDELRRKREELKARLFASKDNVDIYPIISYPHPHNIVVIYYPAEIETMQGTGALYGEKSGDYHISFYVTTNIASQQKIGEIFKEKPTDIPDNTLIGYYRDGVLEFDFKSVQGFHYCSKKPYSLFESWLNGKIEIKYT